MPRVNTVKKSQKKPGTCGKCGATIKKGDGYRWWKFRYGGKRIRCLKCPGPRASELTNSDKLSRCYAAGESIDDAIAAFREDYDTDALRSALEEAAGEVHEVADEYRESGDNIESGFGHETQQSNELKEWGDNLEGKADEIESAAGQIEDFDEDAAKREVEEGALSGEKFENEEAKNKRIEELVQEKREAWAEDQVSEAENLTDISPEG